MTERFGTIESLCGEELNTVSFVMDYVDFGFNGPILRALANPTIEVAGRRWTFPASGSRDALCTLIGQSAESVSHTEGHSIVLTFSPGTRLVIPLGDDNPTGESAHYLPRLNGPLQVFE